MRTDDKKHKKRSAIIAVVLAAAILLTGTFAWQSISQQAKNETLTLANVGGRLHDDFDGTNKDVYVENFTDPDEGGVPIFARIRLDEYLETGQEAGMNQDAADREATPLITGTSIKNVKTWKPHIPSAEGVGSCDLGFHDSWKWTLGGDTIFMPTFNKNRDSLKADINGTLAGPDKVVTTEPDDDRYEDYIDYTNPANASKTADAVYDADSNDVDEEGAGLSNVEGTNYTLKEETHIVKETQTGTVISMSQWLADGQKPGKYWVYDEDGWAYWAEALQPGEATGLLLDEIEMTQRAEDNCYYAINVVAQFATLNDLGKKDNTGFYDTSSGTVPSENAELLLRIAAGMKSVITITAEGDAAAVTAGGDTLQFNASVTFGGVSVDDEITWSMEGNESSLTTLSADGVLDVAEEETAETITICAKSNADGSIAKKTIKVNLTPIGKIKNITPGSTDTVNIDGIDWYVLVNDEGKNQALLWSKEVLPSWGTNGQGAFGTSNNTWRDSTVRSWFNNETSGLLSTLTYLRSKVVPVNINTREQYDVESFITTKDKVFLLSEADLYGTHRADASLVLPKDYTYGGRILAADVELRKCSMEKAPWYWMRSPRGGTTCVGDVPAHSGQALDRSYSYYYNTKGGVRPALWVNLAP